MSEPVKYRRYKHSILEYLHENVGRVVRLEELTEALELNVSQIRNGMNDLLRDGHDITVVIKAHHWTLNSTSLKEPERDKPGDLVMFELIRVTKSGSILLESPDGEVYKADKIA
jgi:hypothetical protein